VRRRRDDAPTVARLDDHDRPAPSTASANAARSGCLSTSAFDLRKCGTVGQSEALPTTADPLELTRAGRAGYGWARRTGDHTATARCRTPRPAELLQERRPALRDHHPSEHTRGWARALYSSMTCSVAAARSGPLWCASRRRLGGEDRAPDLTMFIPDVLALAARRRWTRVRRSGRPAASGLRVLSNAQGRRSTAAPGTVARKARSSWWRCWGEQRRPRRRSGLQLR
jgi:hypothetical protein